MVRVELDAKTAFSGNVDKFAFAATEIKNEIIRFDSKQFQFF